MGVPVNSLLDLISNFRSWVNWGISGISSLSGEVKMAEGGQSQRQSQTMCCGCELGVSESCVGYSCERCSRLFCESCVEGCGLFVVESKSIRSCKFCSGFEIKQKFGGKFSHKIHPCDSPRQSPEPASPNYSGERFDGSNLKAVSVYRSAIRSDEDEGEYSSKSIISPYSIDSSDVESSSVNTRHDFYSFMSVDSSPSDSPCRTRFTSTRLSHSVQPDEQETPRSLTDGSYDQEPLVAVLKSHQNGPKEPDSTTITNDDLSTFRDQYEPLDLEKQRSYLVSSAVTR
ncbi:hypothetical protein HanRHA438_Chr17g0837371 [Helianthus annuus]|nr:hypothetical protein HanRHA438_Chr17g0837371 [Helianthus annuus]